MSIIGQQIGRSISASELGDKIIPHLYAQARTDGNILEYNKHDMRFEYASIRASDHPETGEITSVFLYACSKPDKSFENGGMIIVFEDLVDAKFKEYAAVHEYGELRSGHDKGTQLEMDIARKEGNLEDYLKWIVQNYPQRLNDLKKLNIYPYPL